jgi:hypothetical protein
MTIDFNKPYNKYVDILPFVTDDSRKVLMEQAAKIRDPYTLTLAEFFACCEGDFSCVLKDQNNITTGEGLWLETFRDFVADFCKILERLVIPQTPEQKQASANCLSVEWQEGMLVFVRAYFGLKSFAEAENVTIGDYLLAKKDDYNANIFQRNMAKIQTQKIHKK